MPTPYRIEDFLETKSAGSPTFSPDGNSIAFLSNVTGTQQLYIVPRTGGEPVQLTTYDDSVHMPVFSPVKNEIVFSKAEGGNEKTQMYLFDVEAKSIRVLTHKPDATYHFGGWSFDGKQITYASNERNGTDFDVYVMEVSTGESRRVFGDQGWCDSAGFSPRGTYVVVRKRHANHEHDFYLIDLRDDSSTLITREEEKSTIKSPRWLPDESGFFVVSSIGRDMRGLLSFDMGSKAWRYVLTPEHEVEGAAISLDGELLAVMVNKDGYRTMTVHDTERMEPVKDQTFPKGMAGGASWSDGGKFLTFSLVSATKNSDVWVWSREENACQRVTHSPRRIPEEVFVEPELIRYTSFDGLEIPAFLFLPKDVPARGKVPAIIDIHGGPESQFRPGFDSFIQYFVYKGYAVIAPNVRGSSGYGKKYLALDDVRKRMDSVADLAHLHKFLEQDGRVDAKKVALMGGSYGGFMALAGLTFYPELWAAGVDIVGISNFVTFLENTAPYRRALREAEYGSLSDDRDFLESISPLNFIEKVQAPLFIIHGANDPRVPLSEAKQMHDKLEQSGRRTELLVYEDEGHGLQKLKNRLDAYPKVVDFLDAVVKDRE